MIFEKFYLIDLRGRDSRPILKFCHCESGKEIKCKTSDVIKILQMGEIQVQTRFATNNLISRYAKHNFRNLRQMKLGDPINIYFVPVEYSEKDDGYIVKFYSEEQENPE